MFYKGTNVMVPNIMSVTLLKQIWNINKEVTLRGWTCRGVTFRKVKDGPTLFRYESCLADCNIQHSRTNEREIDWKLWVMSLETQTFLFMGDETKHRLHFFYRAAHLWTRNWPRNKFTDWLLAFWLRSTLTNNDSEIFLSFFLQIFLLMTANVITKNFPWTRHR